MNVNKFSDLKEKSFLIIGGTGSLGKQLISRLSSLDKEIIIYSRDEAKQWTIKNELKSAGSDINISFKVGDIRDKERLTSVILETNPDVIIIAAALKQVDTCELSPDESIKTNIAGPQNVVKIVEMHHSVLNTSKVLMISTDKACEPVNVYGMSKSIAERIVTSMSHNKNMSKIKFLATRYGNVLDSRGSIIPLFKYQAENDEYLTITHKDMTRFVMTLDESVDLIFSTLINGSSGETWIPKLPSMKIYDLVQIFAETFNKKIKKISIRPGEKIHENLLSKAESLRATKKDGFYVIFSSLQQCNTKNLNIFDYNSSQDLMTKEELRTMLEEKEYLEKNLSEFVGKSINDIDTKVQ